ncbi:hypothetical protein GU926_10420 [Nibribacter ruber]|uniref:Uncharacterized protein n=1 Tax=Nibribacter ruber TaxID=2698458 RepID=A0A6P1NXS6_9BACT|nr:hypothetical protein [Nibribacter ruber]QHL87820.1 hypothetical protein GU926_10420 [Nibribacter ruber]
MRTLFNTLLAILFVLVILNVMFWGLAYAYGSEVPSATDTKTLLTLLVLGTLIALVFFLRRRFK